MRFFFIWLVAFYGKKNSAKNGQKCRKHFIRRKAWQRRAERGVASRQVSNPKAFCMRRVAALLHLYQPPPSTPLPVHSASLTPSSAVKSRRGALRSLHKAHLSWLQKRKRKVWRTVFSVEKCFKNCFRLNEHKA